MLINNSQENHEIQVIKDVLSYDIRATLTYSSYRLLLGVSWYLCILLSVKYTFRYYLWIIDLAMLYAVNMCRIYEV